VRRLVLLPTYLYLGSCATGGGLPGIGVILPAEFHPLPPAIKSGTFLASSAADATPQQSNAANMTPASKAVLSLDIPLSSKSGTRTLRILRVTINVGAAFRDPLRDVMTAAIPSRRHVPCWRDPAIACDSKRVRSG